MGRRSALIALATSILVGLACPDLTWSQDAAATAYEGTQEAGGPVRLIVSGDGARIVLFEAEGVAGGGCSWDTITIQNWGDAIQIVEGAFAVTNADGDVLDGSRIAGPDGPPRIEGTIKVHDPVKGCETPSLRWVATAANP